MNFESLANELVLDLFEYLPAVHLLRAFQHLNRRLDRLIATHFQKHRLDFRGVSKEQFHLVCQLNLPSILDQIVSLGLSDDDENPQEFHLFLSSGLRLNQFVNLRSLNFDHLRSSELIGEVLFDCPNLAHLKLVGCFFGCSQSELRRFFDRVWTLPTLIDCYFDIDLKVGLTIPLPNSFSSSIQRLSIVGFSYRIDQIPILYEHTPCLRYLALDLLPLRNEKQFQTSINEMNLVFVGPHHGAIESLFKFVPNLSQLKIETCYMEIDGFDWEKIIRQYLPNLKIFHLKMRFQIFNEIEKQELFRSFRTPFWLVEHRWFVRFHYNPNDVSKMICCYTLPYKFSYLDILFPVIIQSTSPDDQRNNPCYSYDYVQHLVYRSTSTDEMLISNFTFPNVTYLSVQLPVNNHLLSLVRNLFRLTTLEISKSLDLSDLEAQSQLQSLLDQIPNLSVLKFKSWKGTSNDVTPAVIRTPSSIRQVNLLGFARCFNEQDCIKFSHSSLAIHCEVLYIKVKQRTEILFLLQRLSSLRALIFSSEDDPWKSYWASGEDSCLHWLQQNISSTCSIQRDPRYVHHIRIWID